MQIIQLNIAGMLVVEICKIYMAVLAKSSLKHNKTFFRKRGVFLSQT